MSDNKKKYDNDIKTGRKKNTWKSIGSAVLTLGALVIALLRDYNKKNNQNS